MPQLKKIRHDRSERRQLVQALCEIEGLSNRAAANVIGADERTVRNDLKASSTAENSAPAKRLGKDGKSRPVKQPKPKDFSDLRAKNEYGRTMSLANLMHEVANEAALATGSTPRPGGSTR
ncbi:hypothetical protein GS508_22480 [Rhodococcus hoagii]|nr:hypothetical protein [Prescottella equi]